MFDEVVIGSAMGRRIIVDLVEGDDAPDLSIRFLGLDLGDYSLFQLHVETDKGARFSRSITPDGTDDELGTVAWSSGDLVRGRHRAECELTQTADGKSVTVPTRYAMILNVRRDFG